MTVPSEPWRLIVTPGGNGAWNMALDQAILEQVGAENSPPTLRFFAWNPACLSLGQAQRASDADLDRLRERGWTIVRRPTGGRAILHTDELTYSVSFPLGHPVVAGDIVTSYRRISGALLAGLETLGLAAQADKRAERVAENAKGPVCFEVPSDYEITANGGKLIGSAQVRKFDGVLQHGSLPLHGDLGRICDALAFPDEAARDTARVRVLQRATTLERVLGRVVAFEEAAQAVRDAFARTFGVDIRPAEEPTPAELERAAALVDEVYGADAWTFRL